MTDVTVAAMVARMLKARGVQRVFALCGGHIMPMWMALDAEGIEIVDVRDERGAVMMAHASAAVTGTLGVAMVTAGPGVTNAMTGIANAHVSRIPVLVISGLPPRPQENRGALQDMVHVDLLRPLTRYARTIRHVTAVPRELDAAIAAALGHAGEAGPSYIDLPVDLQREIVPVVLRTGEHVFGRPRPRAMPVPQDLDAAADMIAGAARVLVVSGRGANGAGAELARFLTASGAAYLDTGESKGIVPPGHPAHVTAMRGQAMKQADLVVTLGRKLDFQLAYGSPAVFGKAAFLRISDQPAELSDNRLGSMALAGDIPAILDALSERLSSRTLGPRQWLANMSQGHRSRAGAMTAKMQDAAPGSDGRINPNRLLAEIRQRLDPDAIVIADGGDILSFARVALEGTTYLDPGPLGCIGIATPFAVGAAKAAPGRQVVAVTGDGSFGFTAMEIDTAVRHRAAALIVVSNNASWAIEVRDQTESFGRVVGTRLQDADHAAMARAFGMQAWRVTTHEEIGPALDAALSVVRNGAPALIDAVTTPEIASSDSKSGLAWVPDYQALETWDTAERAWLTGGQEE
ncbi:thiamine pyrophosphate-binding protein [Paracoccus sp. SY]|uniref:thiamine pyrophosphate-binding protein n=1 Tax=Paracoccus sp. SY TaxID=1330255 RepID=UPI0019621D35|nr:thiamine pyrophosphate-binding protein [Paracoccus sp. SY]